MSKEQIRNFTILLGSTTTVLAAIIISPALPGMAQAFAAVPGVDFLVPLALTMPALFIAIGGLFAGPLLDRWGRKPVIVVSLLLYGLAGTSGFFLDSLGAILVSRALLGIAVAGIMSGFTTLILDFFKGKELNRFLGLQGAFIGLGGMVFLLLAGFLADLGWEYPFLVHVFALLILPLVIYSIEEPEVTAVASDHNTPKAAIPWRKIAPIYATSFVGMLLFFIFPSQLPFFLAESTDVSNSQVGLALSLQTLSSFVFALQFQRLSGRFSFIAIMALVFAVFGFNHVILSLSAAYVPVIVGLLIGGIGIGLFPPNNNSWLASVAVPELRGKLVGGLTAAIFLGQFFSPIVAQPFVQQIGYSGLFAAAGVAAFVLAGLFGFAASRQKTPPVVATENNV